MLRYHPYGSQMIQSSEGEWIRYSDVEKLQKQLEEVTRERDQYKRACELNDALANARRLTVVVPE